MCKHFNISIDHCNFSITLVHGKQFIVIALVLPQIMLCHYWFLTQVGILFLSGSKKSFNFNLWG